jgi:sec-independent protein translocase protein TatA
MFGGEEWLVIAIVALVLFGGAQLPKLARSLGEAQRELKKAMADDDAEDVQPATEQSGTEQASTPTEPRPTT